jgi:uncharacterized UBP type Zn finger protein
VAHKTIKKESCQHTAEMKITTSDKKACEARLPDGQVCGEKENLRLCTSCGQVFCCQSHQAHNEEHFKKTGHPIIKPTPATLPYDWTWCWVDNAYLE